MNFLCHLTLYYMHFHIFVTSDIIGKETRATAFCTAAPHVDKHPTPRAAFTQMADSVEAWADMSCTHQE